MITVGITGAGGLIGFHLQAYLSSRKDVSVTCAARAVFDDADAMDAFVSGVDVVVHLAYINRGSDAEVAQANPDMARRLVEACERTGRVKQIAFSSSTQMHRDNVYGRSKRDCAGIFRQWADNHDAVFSNIIFPHVFGEYGKPFSNSVVSTFCYQLAHQEQPRIDHDGELELLHAQDAAALIHACIGQKRDGDIPISGTKLRVSDMLARLSGMVERYAGGVIPDVRDALSLRLFNTYRSYLFPHHYPVRLALHADERGELFEAVKTDNGGQAFMSTTRPGITRGNHFHYHKVERFLVVRGEAVIALRRLGTDEVVEFQVSGAEPRYVDIPTLCTHNIRNVGDGDLLTLFWSHEIFDPDRPDTFHEPVYRDRA